jgi:hypothetical protein
LRLTIFAALAATLWGAEVRSSELSFHQYLKHQHSEMIVLPKLYEPVPKHVPVLTDRQVFRLWLGPGSPIPRDPKIEKQLYEAVVAWRDHNPPRFDHEHPTLGHLIRDREFFNYAIHLYNTHQVRFVHYHHQLIPFLRGMAMELMQAPTSPGTGAGGGSSPGVSPAPEGETNTPPLGPSQPLEVPEPLSIVLLTLGIGFLGTGIWARRRIGRRGRAQKPYGELIALGR